jgi:hypothetical protein
LDIEISIPTTWTRTGFLDETDRSVERMLESMVFWPCPLTFAGSAVEADVVIATDVDWIASSPSTAAGKQERMIVTASSLCGESQEDQRHSGCHPAEVVEASALP